MALPAFARMVLGKGRVVAMSTSELPRSSLVIYAKSLTENFEMDRARRRKIYDTDRVLRESYLECTNQSNHRD
jgi:hypothetical protein